MSDKNIAQSLDELLDGIRREREIKAGLVEPQPAQQEDPSASFELPETDYHRPADSLDDLLREYLPEQEHKAKEEAASGNGQKKSYVRPSAIPRDELYTPLKPREETDGSRTQVFDSLSAAQTGSAAKYEQQDPADAPDIMSEQQAELELSDRRKKRIDEFRVFASGLEDEALQELEQRERKKGRKRAELFNKLEPKKGEGLFDAVEELGSRSKKKKQGGKFVLDRESSRRERNEKEKAERKLFNVKNQRQAISEMKTQAQFLSLTSAVITLVLIFLAALPHFYQQGGTLETLIGGSGRVYLAMNLALIVLAMGLSFDTIRSSVRSVVHLTPNSDTVVFIALFFATLHNTVLLIKGNFFEYGGTLYNSAAAFSLLLNSVTKYMTAGRMDVNLKTLTKAKTLYSVQKIENHADARHLAYGISTDGNPEILYAAACEIPDSFSSSSRDRSGEERFFGFAVPAILIAGIIAGISAAVCAKNIIGFLTGLTGCVCMCLPVTMTFLSGYLIYSCNKTLHPEGSCILGYRGIIDIEDTNAFIMDSRDIFFAEVSNFHVLRQAQSMTQQAALTYAAAVLINGGCILSDVFTDIVKEYKINLPIAEDVKYEDRLGFSAWVHDAKVLVGNRRMMDSHNVQLPLYPEKDTNGTAGIDTVYVALEGKPIAAFTVRYTIRKSIARQVKRLTDNGVVLMLVTKDPAVTEEFVSHNAGIKSDSVKITNSKGSDILRLYTDGSPRKRESVLLCKDLSSSMLRLVNATFRLVNADRQASVIQMIGLILAGILSIGLILIGAPYYVSPLVVIAYQVVWGIISCFISERTLNKK